MPKSFSSLSLALILAMCLGGCASLKCSPENCATDAKITADVRAMFTQHVEYGAPGAIRVQTINGTVYLYGKVSTDLVRRNAEALVNQVPNVKGVVNSLHTDNVGY